MTGRAKKRKKQNHYKGDFQGHHQGYRWNRRQKRTTTSKPLPLNELQEPRKDFSHHPCEHFTAWLLQCWDNGDSNGELEGKEARLLGSLAKESGIDKRVGKKDTSP